MSVTKAEVATDRPERYAKQLVSHLGRKREVVEDGPSSRLTFEGGSCTITPGDGVLVLEASAQDAETMAEVQDVVARHLVRFGEKDGLSVTWGTPVDAS